MLATFAAAFAQGLATAVALQVCGFGNFAIFLAIGSMASLIPLAGAWMVWGPCAALLALQGHWWAAIGLTAFFSEVARMEVEGYYKSTNDLLDVNSKKYSPADRDFVNVEGNLAPEDCMFSARVAPKMARMSRQGRGPRIKTVRVRP